MQVVFECKHTWKHQTIYFKYKQDHILVKVGKCLFNQDWTSYSYKGVRVQCELKSVLTYKELTGHYGEKIGNRELLGRVKTGKK